MTFRSKAEAPLPTEHGLFRMLVFEHEGTEHMALLTGDPRGRDTLVRIHSECITGEAFGSLKCDCGTQLDHALARIGAEGRGVLVYLRQEGRGIGLTNKIRAYALQADGADTVDANRALGLPDDARTYDAAAAVLHHLGVESVRLITNNPDKADGLRAGGICVRSRVPSLVPVNEQSAHYLRTKRDRMRHALPEVLVPTDRC